MRESGNVKHAVITLCLLSMFGWSEAQSVKGLLEKGDRFFLKKDYQNALKTYQEILAVETGDPLVYFKAGVSSLNQENYSQAVAYLEKAYELKPDVDEDIAYHMGMAYQKDHQFKKAGEQFETLSKKEQTTPANRLEKDQGMLCGGLVDENKCAGGCEHSGRRYKHSVFRLCSSHQSGWKNACLHI